MNKLFFLEETFTKNLSYKESFTKETKMAERSYGAAELMNLSGKVLVEDLDDLKDGIRKMRQGD